jgi:hypothetical protein
MKLSMVTVCDAATVREGLLHVLGAGISEIGRPSEPFELGAVLVAVVQLDQDEIRKAADIQVQIQITNDASSEIVLEVGGTFSAGDRQRVGRVEYVPIVVDASMAMLPHYGEYTVRFVVEGLSPWDLPLTAVSSSRPAPNGSD